MQALSIRQPYAHAIVTGEKLTEFREWKSPPKQRGWIAIHAGLKIDRDAYLGSGDFYPEPSTLTTGAIVGIAFISHAHKPRHFVYIDFSQTIALPKPIPYKGKLGFFPVTGDALRSLKRQAKKLGVML